jgi:hypothetical protein
VFLTHDILVWIRIRGSMPLTTVMDPDPAIYATDLQAPTKTNLKKNCLITF